MTDTDRLVTGSDPEAWVDAHGDALYRYALARVGDAAAAEDLVQETFLAALAARGGFRGQASERTWLIGILRNKIVDQHRRRCRERALGAGAEAGDDVVDGLFEANGHWRTPPGAWDVDVGQLVDRREFWEAFARCRGALPPLQGSAFVLRLMEDLGADEVCAALGISEANLWVLLHRARVRLRECLERNWFGREGR